MATFSSQIPRRGLVACAVLVLASCGGGSSSQGDRGSTAPSTVPATSPSTEESIDPTTTEPVPAVTDARFDPPCIERDGDTAVTADDPALDSLQPLGAEPVVQMALPRIADTVPSMNPGSMRWVRPAVTRIPGGMLVDLRSRDGEPIGVSELVAVNADGSLRWQRCLDPAPQVLASPSGDPDEMLLYWTTDAATGPTDARIEVWSLADGRPSRAWADVLAASGVTASATESRQVTMVSPSMVALAPLGPSTVEASDVLLVVDLATLDVRIAPYPPGSVESPPGPLQLGATDDGHLTVLDVGVGVPGGAVRAVETASGWSTSIDDISAAVAPRADFVYTTSPAEMAGFDAAGSELWRRNDLVAPPTEGFHAASSGDVVVAQACAVVDLTAADDPCTSPSLIALDVATGRTLWQRDGRWSVSVIGDGRAMAQGPYLPPQGTEPPESPSWAMIDLATGRQTGTRSWTSPWHFGVGCCDDPLGVVWFGGVVVTVDEDTIELWYPESASTPLRTLALG